jgi:hypothetical protein
LRHQDQVGDEEDGEVASNGLKKFDSSCCKILSNQGPML